MKDLNKKSVCASLANRIISNLLEMGYSWDEINKRSGIYREEIKISSTRVPATKHYQLLKLIDEGGGEGWFLKRKDFSADFFFNHENILDLFSEHKSNFALLCLNSQTLQLAIKNYIKYRDLIGNVDRIDCHLESGDVVIEYFYEFDQFDYQFVSMINFIFISFLVNHYLDEDVNFLVHSKSKKNNIFLNIFNYWDCQVIWESDRNSISFHTDKLDDTYNKFNDKLHYILKKLVDEEYSHIFLTDNIKEKIEDTIREMIRSNDIEFKSKKALDDICKIMKISKTTLSRRLKSLDVSYKMIEKNVKLEEAIKLLNNSNLNIGDVSYQLGFATQSAFNKFFTDSVGMNPLKFRKNN
jgi:AraC-like DNA-binding protein